MTALTKSSEKQPFMVAFFKSGPHAPQTPLPVSAPPRPPQNEEEEEEEDNELEGPDESDEEHNELSHTRSRRDTKRKKKTADMSHTPPDTTHYKNIFKDPGQWTSII